MVRLANIDITLVPPINNDYYSGEENISGSIKLKLTKPLPIKKIVVHLKGITETQTKLNTEYMMSQNGMLTPVQDNRSYHRLLGLEKRLFPPDNVWNAMEGEPKPFKISPGEYNYEFKFEKLGGKRPRCLKNHKMDTICFMQRKDIKLPPSFNIKWKELNKIDNLDLYFYSMGKILYFVELEIEMGKPKTWFKPFDKVIHESKLIEYIPNVEDISYPLRNNEINITDYNNLGPVSPEMLANTSNNDTSSTRFSTNEKGTSTNNTIENTTFLNSFRNLSIQSSRSNVNSYSNGRYRYYRSKFKINIPSTSGKESNNSFWIEIRSKNDSLSHIFLNDPLFSRNSNQLDKIYVVCKGNMNQIKQSSIKLNKLRLNLVERTNFLSQGIANENLSSLRLIELNLSEYNDQLLNLQDIKVRSVENDHSTDNDISLQKGDCPIKFYDNNLLQRWKFNEENYRHRGNRIYSFKTCTIERIFNLQILIDWEIMGQIRQSEIVIEPMQVYCQERTTELGFDNSNSNSGYNDSEYLPRYVEPPVYKDS